MTRRTRLLITGGAMSVALVVTLSLAFCGGKKPQPSVVPIDPPVTTSVLQRVEAAIKAGIAGLTFRVETLEKKPVPKAGISKKAAEKIAADQVAPVSDQLGGLGRRLDNLETVIAKLPVPQQPVIESEPPQEQEEEEELSDEKLARRYRLAVRRGRLPD